MYECVTQRSATTRILLVDVCLLFYQTLEARKVIASGSCIDVSHGFWGWQLPDTWPVFFGVFPDAEEKKEDAASSDVRARGLVA
mmetsp:Transcript_33506/g.56793  ORF Transcript_33506/g.56793 Transcript_33506/m.56793 type:complete len:84 (-) Transcript_33506:129-380(-)